MSGTSRWGRDAMRWMVEAARPAAGGEPLRAVILGAVPLDEPDTRERALLDAGAGEVRSFIVPETGDGHADAARAIDKAHVLFLRGGDQGRYVKGWRHNSLARAIRDLAARGGVVGGTSAGCAVLGEVTYSAENDSLTPDEALADAHHRDATIVRGFTGLVPGVLFDSHFTERGRLGRFPSLLARARELFAERTAPLGVGVDPRTAAAIDARGIAEVRGEGCITLLRESPRTRVHLPEGGPPSVTDLALDVLLAGTTFRVPTGDVLTRPDDATPNPHPETIEERSFEALSLDGSRADDARLGVLMVQPAGGADAGRGARRDAWTTLAGDGRLPGCVVRPRAFDTGVWPSFAEVLRALASAPGLVGLWLPVGARASVDGEGLLTVDAASPASVLLVDATGATHAGTRPGEGAPPNTHLEGVTAHVLGPGWGYSLRERTAVTPEG